MTARTRRLLAQIGSFFLAAVLLYLALRGVDLGEVVRALRTADYTWLVPLVVVVLLSHAIRAWRWTILLKALPEASRPQRHVSVLMAFYSLMIGYMVNYAAPRLGEIARTATLASRERLTFTGVLGTVVVDRVLDIVVLALGLVSAVILLLDRYRAIERLFIDPVFGDASATSVVIGLAIFLAILGITVLLGGRQFFRGDSALRRAWDRRGKPLLVSFKGGLLTVIRSKERAALLVSTILIWFLYLLMAYLPFLILEMAGPYQIGLLDAWAIMILGSIGVVIPSPGGTGSYHYITIQVLVHLFSVDAAPAATYAVLTHAAQLVLYLIVGTASLLLQGSSFRALRERTAAAQEREMTS